MQQDPYQYPPTQQPTLQPQPPKKRSKRTVTALWLLIGPTALLVGTFVIASIINWLAPAAPPTDGALFADPSPLAALSNILVFIAGTISALTFLTGLIIGIVLLATNPRTR